MHLTRCVLGIILSVINNLNGTMPATSSFFQHVNLDFQILPQAIREFSLLFFVKKFVFPIPFHCGWIINFL